MSGIRSILVPLDGSAESARSLGTAVWLARRLDATLHILSAGYPELAPLDELRRLQVPQRYWAQIRLHQAEEFPEQAVLVAVERYEAQLIVMTARGETGEKRAEEVAEPGELLGHVTRWIVEHSPVPVLVLTPAYEERLPWTTALVPISGEPEADQALTVAVRLGNALGLQTTVVHVMEEGEQDSGLTATTRYADAPHHEYPSRFDELVVRALPGMTPAETASVVDVVLCRGDVGDELLKLMEERRISLLVIGWHGTRVTGHARIVKSLLSHAVCPVLLVKAAPRAPFVLKVGAELE